MPSQAQLARINTVSDNGKVATKLANVAERLRAQEAQQVPQICCQAWNSLNIAVASGAWQALTLDTNNYDVFGMHTAGDSEVYAVVPGKYVVSACIIWASSVAHASGAGVRLVRNGTTVFAAQFYYSTDLRSVSISGMIHLSAVGDYVELEVQQNTGAPVNVLTSSIFSPVLGVHKYG